MDDLFVLLEHRPRKPPEVCSSGRAVPAVPSSRKPSSTAWLVAPRLLNILMLLRIFLVLVFVAVDFLAAPWGSEAHRPIRQPERLAGQGS